MRKLKLFFACLLMAVLSIGQMWAGEVVVYTLDGTTTATGSAYATASSVTQGSKSWQVTANTEQNPWRIGGKGLNGANRIIYGETAFEEDITKVEVSMGATASSLTINSIKMIVSTEENGGGTITDQETKTSDLASATSTFSRPAGHNWSGKYFTFVFNVTRTSNSGNGYITFNNAKFYAEESTGGDPVPVLQSIAVSEAPTKKTYEEGDVFEVAGLVVTGTYDIGDPAVITEGITWKARTNALSDDAVALANYTLTEGQTSLQVQATANEKVSEWYTVNELTVNEHVVNPGKYTITLNNALWGTSYTSTQTSTSANALDLSGKSNDVQVALTNGTSLSMYITDGQTRAYSGYTLTFTAPSDHNITKLEFTKASKWGLVCESGLNADADTWTGEATSVTFTFSARTDMTSVDVTYAAIDYSIVKTLKEIAVNGMTQSYEVGDAFSFDGTCTATYTVTQGSTSLPEENKPVIPTEVSEPDMNTTGEKEVTISFTDGGITKTAKYNITVNPHTVTPGEYEVLLNNVLWGVDAGQQAATVEDMAGSSHDINFATTKGSNQMYASATQTRFYTNATLTISAPTGYNITSVVFAEPSSDKQWNGSISADEGTYTADTKTWSGEVAAVVFTFGAQNRIATATVTYALVDPTAPTVSVATSIDDIPAAGVTDQVLDVSYTYVDLEHVAYALFNDAECQNSFIDEWLNVSLNDDKDIVYTLSANTSFTEGRTAYIQLTAPAHNGTSPAVVKVIAVEQLTKEYVFASLAELLENITPTTTPVNVTVTLTNEVITGFAYGGNQNQYKNGVKFNVNYGVGQSQEMEIYFHDVPGEWVAGGKISGTLTNCPWKIYSGTWELAPSTGWAWDNGDLSYTAPKAVTGVEVSGQPETKVYTVGETFNPEGLTVTVSYNEGDPEVNPVGVTFTTDPANGKMALEQTSIKVKATFNNVTSEEWFTVNGLTVNDLPTKTVNEFITDGGGRCYLIGTVSNITNTQYGNFDLTDASGTIYVYGCLDTNGASKNFENLNVEEDDYIKVIAETYEYYQQTTHEAKNVQFVEELEKPVVPTVTLKQAGSTVTSLNLDATGVATQAIDIVCGNFADAISSVSAVLYEESICETEITSGAWVTDITIDGAKLTFNIADNAGDARQVWLKVTASDGTNSAFAVLAISQAKYTVDYAELPFAYDGNGSGELPNGFTNSGVGTYSSSPAMKFDGTGDYIIIKINAAPGTLTYDIKGNSFSGGTFKVQQSANGVDYSDVATYTELGSTQSEAKTLDETTRYVKFIYTEKVSGNVGLGNITIAPQYETIRGGLTSGNYYTVCYNRKMKEIRGASLWSFVGNEGNKVSIVEAEAPYAAGTPYLVYAESDKLEAIVEVVDNPSAGNNNGLYGTFSYMDADALSTAGATHMLKNNEIRLLGNNNHLDANRAYIILDNIDAVQPAPGRRVRAIPMHSNVVTGCDEINASETPVKMIIDGQIFILRGEKMYDTTGRLVK